MTPSSFPARRSASASIRSSASSGSGRDGRDRARFLAAHLPKRALWRAEGDPRPDGDERPRQYCRRFGPRLGDAFSVWFKSNARNQLLFQRHAGTARRVALRDWLFVGALLGGMLALIVLFFLATFGLALQALHWIFGAH